MGIAEALLVLTQAAGLGASIYNPVFWIARDVAAIQADAAKDSLHRLFHRQRTTWRLGIAVAISVASILPALFIPAHPLAVALFGGQLAFNGCYFFAQFNPGLNQALNLPYKPKWYVSWNPSGSRFDYWLWCRAWAKQGFPPPPVNGPDAETQRLAGLELERLSTVSTWASVSFYVVCAGFGYWLSYGL